MNSQLIIIKHLSGNLPFHDSLTNHFNGFASVNHHKIPSGGYQSLNSVGIGVLRNDSLRMKIVDLYDRILPLIDSDFENDVVSRREWMRNTEIYEHFRWRDFAFDDTYEGRENINYNELMNDDTFENLLRSLYHNRRWFNGVRTWGISEMMGIIKMIELESD